MRGGFKGIRHANFGNDLRRFTLLELARGSPGSALPANQHLNRLLGGTAVFSGIFYRDLLCWRASNCVWNFGEYRSYFGGRGRSPGGRPPELSAAGPPRSTIGWDVKERHELGLVGVWATVILWEKRGP